MKSYLHVEIKPKAGAVRVVDRKVETQCFTDKELKLKDRFRRTFKHL
jgi:hypothetical protein